MDSEAILQIVLKARDEASAAIAQVGDSVTAMSGNAQKGTEILTKGMLVAGAAVVGISTLSLKAAGDFQSSMTQLVTGAGESEGAINMVSQAVLNMATVVGDSPKELAAGLYNIESAGFHGAAGLQVLQIAAEGAKVGNAEMATVADALTSALNAYHLPATDATKVTNDLIATVAAGKMHMQDLAGSLGAILPIASTLGVKLPEVSGAIATMTMQGTDATTATQSLRFLLASLAGPTSAAATEFKALGIGEAEIPGITAQASAALKDMGLKTSDVADTLSKKGLSAALDMITESIGKKFPAGSAEYEAALKNAVGGTRGLTAALELTGQNATTLQSNIKGISGAFDSSGNSVKGWALVQQDLNTQMDKFSAAVQVVAIKYGNVLLPAATTVANFLANNLIPDLTNVANWIDKNRGVLEVIAGVIMTVVIPAYIALKVQAMAHAAQDVAKAITDGWNLISMFIAQAAQITKTIAEWVIHNATMVIGTAVTWAQTVATGALSVAMFILTSPIALVVLAIVALIAIGVLLITHWQLVQSVARTVFADIGNVFSKLGTLVKGVMDGIIADIKNMINSAIQGINTLINGVNSIAGKIPGIGGSIHIPNIPYFENGGPVLQTGLAYVHQGEFVLSKDMLAGRQSVPGNIFNQNQSQQVNINIAQVNSPTDWSSLGAELAWRLKNSR